jgi:murein DD-endopeptidase MepM/ murein hydrolase activator NlpD
MEQFMADSEVRAQLQPLFTVQRSSSDSQKPLFDQWVEAGLTPQKVDGLVHLMQDQVNFRRIRPSAEWEITFLDDLPVRLTLQLSPVEIFDVFDIFVKPVLLKREVKTKTETRFYHGKIESSLFEAFSGMPKGVSLAVKVAEVFAWDIDFYMDPRQGDEFEFMVEATTIEKDGDWEFYEYGKILAGRYFGKKGKYDAFLFTDKKGKPAYFNSKGQSLVRSVLRSPLKLVRVTSSFRGQRFHPILKKRRPHNGVDYGAPKNTPVMAVADGKVISAGRMGGAGIAVVLSHKGKMITQYFHLNAIAKSVRRGRRVHQGQVIGYVGKTGLATGYHLHFGMKIRGKYVNPQRQKFQPGTPISKKRLPAFRKKLAEYEAMYRSFNEPIAMPDVSANSEPG